VYCLLCGNPAHGFYDDDLDVMSEDHPDLREQLVNMKKSIKWIEKCTFLTTHNRVIHGVQEKRCNTYFCLGKWCGHQITDYLHEFVQTRVDRKQGNLVQGDGVFVHTDCWKHVHSTYGLKLHFGHLPKFPVKKLTYGGLEKYREQFLNYVAIIRDGKPALCSREGALQNVERNIRKLGLHKELRSSPCASATDYKEGEFKLGNNNHLWKKQSGRWVEIKEPLIQSPPSGAAQPIGLSNTCPIFTLDGGKVVTVASW